MLYKNIETLCAAVGISIFKLCKDTGISPGILSDLKAGRTKELTARNLLKIAGRLGCSVEMLMSKKYDE